MEINPGASGASRARTRPGESLHDTDHVPHPMYRVAALLVSASAIRYAGQLVLLVLIARSAGVAGVGTYTVALAVCAPVFIIAGFGIRTVRLTLRREVPTRTYERFLFTSLVCACILVAGIGLLLPPMIGIVVVFIALLRTGETFMELYGAMLQRGGRVGWIVAVVGTGAVLQVAAVACTFALGGGLVVALAASAAAYLLVFLAAARPLAHAVTRDAAQTCESPPMSETQASGSTQTSESSPKPPSPPRPPSSPTSESVGDWKVLFAAGLPTGIAIGTITLLSTVPQYLLGWVDGVEDAGRFAVLLYVVVAVEVLLHALAQSWIPQARALLDRAQLTLPVVAKTSARWTLLAGVPGLVGLLAAALVLPGVLGPQFAITPALALPLAVTVLLVPASFAADTAVVVRNRYALSLSVSVIALIVGSAIGAVLVGLGLFTLSAALWTFAATMAVRAAVGFAVVLSSGSRTPHRSRGARRVGPAAGPRGSWLTTGSHTVRRDPRSAVNHAILRFWPVLPIAVAVIAVVRAGPVWALASAGAVLLIVVLTLVRVGVPELLVMTVPLAFYVTVGGMLFNLAVSDVLLLLLIVRILVDPDSVRGAAHVSGAVRTALCVLALVLALTAATIMVRSSVGAPTEWTAFAADAVKLVVVIAYFVVCVVVFRDLLLRGDYRFLTVWATTAAFVGALGTVGAILFSQGRQTGLTMDFRATGTFEDPNAFATYLIMSLPLALLARHVTGKSLVSWHQLPIIAGIIASFSRGALVGLAAVLVVLCFFAFRDPALRALRIVALVCVCAAAVFVLDGAISSVFEGSRGVNFSEDVRFRLWAAAIDVWLLAPLTGVGLGQFVVSAEGLVGSAGGVLAHNTYLSILAEVGLIGTVLYLAVPALAVVGLMRRGDTVARLLLASGVGVAVMAVSLNLQNFRPIWLFLALAIAWCVTPRRDVSDARTAQVTELHTRTHPHSRTHPYTGTHPHILVHPHPRTERSWN